MTQTPRTESHGTDPAAAPRRHLHGTVGATLLALAAAALVSCGGGGGGNDDDDFVVPASGRTAPADVRMTWFGVSNWTLKIGDLNILIDGYMTRIPQNYFSGGGGGLAVTKAPWPIDKAEVEKVNGVLSKGPGSPINLILTGHSHFDHSFDTPHWAKITGAHVIGSRTTCFQVRALGVPESQCTPVYGGETFQLNERVTMRVVRWNHSGSHENNPEQHDPVELQAVPKPDANGALRGGVGEDFPNGGGNRGYLFTVRTADNKTINFFWTNSGAPQDLTTDSITDGVNYGSPIASLTKAMQDAKLDSLDLWIGAGGQPVASLTVPVIHPKVFMPNHLGSFYTPFSQGNTGPFRDPTLGNYLVTQGVGLVAPAQYLDAWVLDTNGLRAVDNGAMKQAYGF
ncbi:MBL fold metallo-hydrolase [Piscinibacter koreensis]|uniref:MBL fold metallo-hydrolase n=1 Tax=Piscinibacter koreensis TaxID=2742824 RepID=A0A7Y6TXC1_9BURK|nr:MBL fold metallo-hydrolase [Schlegelella koreensis]NUZ06891.1 MBL fold metallo-hydrolase [Schlegelella koreensis]